MIQMKLTKPFNTLTSEGYKSYVNSTYPQTSVVVSQLYGKHSRTLVWHCESKHDNWCLVPCCTGLYLTINSEQTWLLWFYS